MHAGGCMGVTIRSRAAITSLRRRGVTTWLRTRVARAAPLGVTLIVCAHACAVVHLLRCVAAW